MEAQSALIRRLTDYITDQVFLAFGFSDRGWARRWLWPLAWPPARAFSALAAEFDQRVAEQGVRAAMRWLLPRFVRGLALRGLENVPPEGPVLVVSNHPGTFDSVAISASLERPDLKIVATGIPFLRELPATRQHLIYSTLDTYDRMNTLRQSLRHLEQGGALLIFPSGRIDPDPAFLPGAEKALENWSSSVELFLRRVPQTRLLITMVSGVLVPGCMRNPLVRLRKIDWEQRRIAEFIQIIQQVLIPRRFNLKPRITFASPLDVRELLQDTRQAAVARAAPLLAAVKSRARHVLDDHLAALSRPATWYEAKL